MYETHFGLRQRPFLSTQDCGRYYPSTIHEDVLSALMRALQDEEGLSLLTGEPGVGKTLLCHCLLQRGGDGFRNACLTNTHFGDLLALLQGIAFELGVPHEGRSEQSLRLAIIEDLLQHCAEKGPTILFVDEAHHLKLDMFEEMRLLGNLEGEGVRALHVLLVAQPDVQRTLEHSSLGALRQRLAVRAHLQPLPPTEAADYLLHHLRMATDRPEKLIMPDALELIAHGTRGIPRLLNQAAHRALTLACLAAAPTVDAEAALEAMLALGLSLDEPEQDEQKATLPEAA